MHSGEKPNKCDQCEGKSGCQSHQTPQESATAAVPRISVYCLSASLSDSVTQIAQWFWWLVWWQYWRLHPTQQQLFQVSSKKWLGYWVSPQWLSDSNSTHSEFPPEPCHPDSVHHVAQVILVKAALPERALLSQWVKLLSDFGDSFCPVTLVSQLVLRLLHRP